MIHFILGGARSGKSRFAEEQVTNMIKVQDKKAVYLATATAIDPEMQSRITKHQSDREKHWQLIECPLALADTLTNLDKVIDPDTKNVYLIDCLTLWLNNHLFSVTNDSATQQSEYLQNEIDHLVSCLSRVKASVIIVSNEIGLGVIPMGESTRLYVDYCGWMNQRIAKVSDKVTLVTAGIPLCIKELVE